MIKCCVFDLDGTLLNTIDTITHYVNSALQRFGLPAIDKNECIRYVGNGARKLTGSVMDSFGVEDSELSEQFFLSYTSEYDKAPHYLTEAYEGVREVLETLKAKGLKLAVLSNKPDFATKAAVKHFFRDSFDVVFGAREGVALKPSPDSLIEIIRQLGAKPSECAYIGDSEVDVKTGNAAGVALNISALWGFRSKEQLLSAGAVRLIKSPVDLLCEI